MIETNERVDLSPPNQSGYHFTARQVEVLNFLVKGLGNRQFADFLGLQPSTVTCHLKQSYKKLGLHTRTAVAAKILSEQILTSLDPAKSPVASDGRLSSRAGPLVPATG